MIFGRVNQRSAGNGATSPKFHTGRLRAVPDYGCSAKHFVKTTSFFLFGLAVACVGSGGVADHVAKHSLRVQLLRSGQALAGAPIDVSFRAYADTPFSKPQSVTTDSEGRASVEFRARWSSAFLVIPPIGNVPRRAPRPTYLVACGSGNEVAIGPSMPDCNYRWHKRAWETDAKVLVP